MFGQENLVRVAIWCIGEYADLLVNNNGMLELDEQITVSSIFRRVFFVSYTRVDSYAFLTSSKMLTLVLLISALARSSAFKKVKKMVCYIGLYILRDTYSLIFRLLITKLICMQLID